MSLSLCSTTVDRAADAPSCRSVVGTDIPSAAARVGQEFSPVLAPTGLKVPWRANRAPAPLDYPPITEYNSDGQGRCRPRLARTWATVYRATGASIVRFGLGCHDDCGVREGPRGPVRTCLSLGIVPSFGVARDGHEPDDGPPLPCGSAMISRTRYTQTPQVHGNVRQLLTFQHENRNPSICRKQSSHEQCHARARHRATSAGTDCRASAPARSHPRAVSSEQQTSKQRVPRSARHGREGAREHLIRLPP